MSDSPHRDDNYLPEDIYKENLPADDGFARFNHEGEWYFAYYHEDEMILRSEGYANKQDRDKGIASVEKHKDENDNYKVYQLPDGKWVLELMAANRKEIARSQRFVTRDEARYWLPSAVVSREQARLDAARNIPKGHVEDDYLRCEAYEDHPRAKAHPEFNIFKHEDEYYFALLGENGDVLLRSEGYKTEKARDNGIESVVRNRSDKDRYKVEEHLNRFFVMLTAGNNREIARSCPLSEDKAHALIAFLLAPVHAHSKAGDDDYLTCKEYEDHPRSETDREFTLFDKNGEHYFALVDEDDNVLLRGEGYESEAARKKGIESVKHHKGNRDRYRTEEHAGYHFVILTAPNDKEIARSCPKSEAAALALIGLLCGPVAATAAPAPSPAAASGGVKWWWWLLLVLALILLFLLWRGCNNGGDSGAADGSAAAISASGPVYASDHDCAWEPILFGFDSDSITAQARTNINGVVREMQSNRSYRALFIGFSDSVGVRDYNAQLSQRRADAARAVAISMGIDSSRISTSELDEFNPVASNKTEAGRTYNRRVVMFVLNEDNHLVCRQQQLEVPEELQE